jgi:hypothetical protein
MKMEKSDLMIEYEIRIDSIVNWESTPVGYTRYLESELIKARSNANITDETIEKFQEIIIKQCDEVSALKKKAEEIVRVLNAICVLFDNGERRITVGERANLMIAKALIEKYPKEWTE